MRHAGGVVLSLLIGSSMACLGTLGGTVSNDPARRLVITGSSTLAPLVAEIAARFEAQNPGFRVDVQSGGSSRGILDVREGTADIGMVSRALYDEESDLTATTIARDGVAVIVHASNPVADLDAEQLRALFTGRLRKWRASEPGVPVVAVNKAAGRATLDVFAAYLDLDPSRLTGDVVIGENEQAVKMVTANRGAVGYVSIGTAAAAIDRGEALRIVPVEGLTPDAENLADGSYPIYRPLNLVDVGEPAPLVARFLEFASSGSVAELIHELDFVPSTG